MNDKQLYQVYCLFLSSWCDGPPVGQDRLIHEVSRSHITTHRSRQDWFVVGLRTYQHLSTPKRFRILKHSLLFIAFAAWILHSGKLKFPIVSSHLRLLLRIRLGSVQWLTSSDCDSNPPSCSLNLLGVQTFLFLNHRQISIAAFVHFDKHAHLFLPSHGWLSLQTCVSGHRRETQVDIKLTFLRDTVIEVFIRIPFIHSAICLTKGPTPLPKRFLHIVRSTASSFKWY